MANEPKIKFKNKNDQASAVEEFQNLKNQPGWKRIVEFYDGKIKWIEGVINGEIKNDDQSSIIKDEHDLELWRAKRNLAIELRNLPDKLSEFIEANQIPEENLDPFDK